MTEELEWVRGVDGVGRYEPKPAGGGSSVNPANTISLEGTSSFVVNEDFPRESAIVWSAIYDRDSNPIEAIPAAMGLELNEGAWSVVATEQGLWLAQLIFNPTQDATAIVTSILSVPIWSGGPNASWDFGVQGNVGGPELSTHSMAPLIAGEEIRGNLQVGGAPDFPAATADPYLPVSYAVMDITRLA